MTEPRPTAGKFVWHDLKCLEPAKGAAFYSQLLGWSTRTMPSPGGPVTVFSIGDNDVADLVPLVPSQGLPSHWTCYITVDDLDAAVATARSLGGEVVAPATDTPPWGRIAVIKDPGGAFFQAFQPSQPPSTAEPAWPPPHGSFVWFELMTADPEAVAPFYQQVFGWAVPEPMDMGPGGLYWLFKRGVDNAAGMMKLPPDVPVANWLMYIGVDDVEAATAKAQALGATVMVPAKDVEGTGRFSVIQDPTGAVVALFTAEPM